MKKICLLTVWMGKMPENFWLWKMTAKRNSTIDFYLITDNEELADEDNIHFLYMNMEQVRDRFEKITGFPIKLKVPYKLCDYKPLYGKAFPEIVDKYDFWGHCDIDLLFGDIRKFITEDMLEQYDKVLECGWFILYRNCESMNNLYKKSLDKDNMAYPYNKAFRNQYACYFDEYMGMSILGWQYCKVFRDQLEEKIAQDFSWQRLNFQSYITGENFVFHWKDGRLYRVLCDETGKVLEESEPAEYMLVHIQKRKMDITFSKEELEEKNEFWIVPNQYQLGKPNRKLYTEKQKQEYAKEIHKQDRQRSIKNLRTYGLIEYIPHFIRSRRIRKWIIREKKFF